MRISELARLTGVSTHALRHYEALGLICPPRSAGGYRDYPESMRREVVFISMSRQIGFSLKANAQRPAAPGPARKAPWPAVPNRSRKGLS